MAAVPRGIELLMLPCDRRRWRRILHESDRLMQRACVIMDTAAKVWRLYIRFLCGGLSAVSPFAA